VPPPPRSSQRGGWSFGSAAPDALLPARDVFAAKERAGHTVLAAGMHRGGAGLALHALGAGDDGGGMSAATTFRRAPGGGFARALAGVPHGSRIVFADSAGWLRWVERDGATAVRAWNVNSGSSSATSGPVTRAGNGANNGPVAANDGNPGGSNDGTDGATFAGPAGLVSLRPPTDDDDDFVTRILPVGRPGAAGTDAAGLVLTTQEGRVGLLGFGAKGKRWGVAAAREPSPEEAGAKAEMEEQALYERRMRWALAAQANEVNFLDGRGGYV
jgi:hypothetical protein